MTEKLHQLLSKRSGIGLADLEINPPAGNGCLISILGGFSTPDEIVSFFVARLLYHVAHHTSRGLW
jgi:hypothetical protein